MLPLRSKSRLRPRSLDDSEAAKARETARKAAAAAATRRERLGIVDTEALTSSVNIDLNLKYSIRSNRSMPDPTYFDGNKEKFKQQYQSLSLKLSISKFKTPYDIVRYIYSRTNKTAQRMLNKKVPKLSVYNSVLPSTSLFNIADNILTFMHKRYRDKDIVTKMFNKLIALKQELGESFSEFYTKFVEYRAYVSVDNEAQEVLIIRNKLNTTYTNRLTTGARFKKVANLKETLYELEGQIEVLNNKNPRKGRSSSSSKGDKNTEESAPKSSTPRRSNPNIFPPTYRNLLPLVTDKRKRYMREGRYLTYRKKGYIKADADKYLVQIQRKDNGISVNSTAVVPYEESLGEEGKGQATI